MEINRTGVTYFSQEYHLIEVLCKHGAQPEIVAGQTYPMFANCDTDAHVFATKAVAQGDEVVFVHELNKGKEATRLLYIGPDGAIVEGAAQLDVT